MALLRLKAAAEVLGVHPVTLRRWADEGRVPVVCPRREWRFRTEDLDRFLGQAPEDTPRREALYLRVSSTTGQESSRVTHEDRLARFGSAWLRQLLDQDGVLLEMAHPKGSEGGLQKLSEDFTALVATFAGRMYGIRSREAERRLLAQAQRKVSGDDGSTG